MLQRQSLQRHSLRKSGEQSGHRRFILNYLAHFHLAGDQDGLIIGALLGDFVKGPLIQERLHSHLDLNQLPANTLAGIQLHRNIDGYFDQCLVREAGINLDTPGQRRFLPIALDLFFDYALIHSWSHYSAIPLDDYCHSISRTLARHHHQIPDKAKVFAERMQQHSLLTRYGDRNFISQVGERLSVRLPPANKLKMTIDEVFEREEEFFRLFENYYPLIYAFAEEQRRSLNQPQ